MKIALVHDYLNEFGGAERVLLALSEIWPKAPIYTAFYKKGSTAYERFADKKIIASWAQNVPFFADYLHSPLRFLAPLIWGSFDFSGFDVVITSASWYVTKGVIRSSGHQVIRTSGKKGKNPDNPTTRQPDNPIEVCYCHTPPRYLYGYTTSVDWQKYWPVRLYALIVNHFMRVYDFEAAQRVDHFIANSKEVAGRIKKFYRRDSTVIYPPVDLPCSSLIVNSSSEKRAMNDRQSLRSSSSQDSTPGLKRSTINDYFLVVSRIVGGKGLNLAVEVAMKMNLKLKVVGSSAGYGREYQKLREIARLSSARQTGPNVEFLGFVEDSELAELYCGARAFLALAQDEDFGITPVEAMLCGTPVIAFDGGGYRETVIQRKTGLFFDPATAGSLTLAINNFLDMEKKGEWDRDFIKEHAQKFNKDRFKKEIIKFVQHKIRMGE
ncbi:glycosyltransferase [Candidatus Curtissbacteria bacterium]|nr:glycosyltransferase [Candidatus Curtissbacteria bacterium]